MIPKRFIAPFLVVLAAGCGGSELSAPSPPDADGSSSADGIAADIVEEIHGSPCETDAECGDRLAPEACRAARCVHGACVDVVRPDLTPCDDGDACTRSTVCLDGACTDGWDVDCDDGNPCTEDTCDPTVGCRNPPAPAGRSCDDGDPCTYGDRCAAGTCAGTSDPACACDEDADCAAFDDEDACNGSLRCLDERCTVDPTTRVSCPDPGACRVAACDPDTGACTTLLAADGTACDDGNPCTTSDACREGVCVGTPGGCPCEEDADCGGFARAPYDLCQGPFVCLGEVCAPDPAGRVVCEGGGEEPCLTTACDPSTGLCATIARADATPCAAADDPCATGTCAQGACALEGAPCDDGEPCTQDFCVPGVGCEHLPAEGPCEDGDPCTVDDSCEAGVCLPGEPATCDDLNPCTVDTCDPEVGCVHTPARGGIPCGADAACTTAGACVDGECVGQEPVTCPAAGPCTEPHCVPGRGCVSKPIARGTPCDDGDPCTHQGACDEGTCKSQPKPCNDGDRCTFDRCDTDLGGCVHEPAPDGKPCTSPDPCLEAATCQEGTCAGGTPVACEDGPCGVRDCDPETGSCVVVEPLEDGTPCGGDDPCATPGACEDGACEGSAPVVCEDGDACTVDACDPDSGSCRHDPVVCKPPGGDACAEVACDPSVGCKVVPAPICDGVTVLWSDSLSCDGEGWSFAADEDAPTFVIDEKASPAGAWDGDCSLHIAPGASPSGTSWTSRAASPQFQVPAGPSITLHFVEWWSGGGADAQTTRRIEVTGPEGEVLGGEALAAAPAPGWQEQELSLFLEPPVEVRVVFRVDAAPPTSEAAWFVDRIVVTAE